MSYYREISFPVGASSQGLRAPFTFAFSPFSPSLLLSVLRQLEIPLSGPLLIPAPGWRNQTGHELGPEAGEGLLARLIHSLAPQAGFDSGDPGSKIKP